MVGLKIRGELSWEYIEMPPESKQDYILVDNTVLSVETAKIWDHLHSMAAGMPNLLNCPVGLLIGYDYVKALKPTKLISGGKKWPLWTRIELGWSIVGPTRPFFWNGILSKWK